MWKCPKCERLFVRVGQQHRCRKGSEEEALKKCSEEIVQLYFVLKKFLLVFNQVQIEAHENRITFLYQRRFVEVSLLKNSINLGFILKRKVDEFPIYDTYGYSKHRCGHLVKLESLDELDSQLKSWLAEAYESIGKVSES